MADRKHFSKLFVHKIEPSDSASKRATSIKIHDTQAAQRTTHSVVQAEFVVNQEDAQNRRDACARVGAVRFSDVNDAEQKNIFAVFTFHRIPLMPLPSSASSAVSL